MTLPFIQLAYYSPLEIPSEEETLLRTAILLGALVGQLTFGFLSDIYGRRKLYGYELMVLLLAIVGVSTSSPGLVGSMSLFGWLFVWRLIMGFGRHRIHSGLFTDLSNSCRHWGRLPALCNYIYRICASGVSGSNDIDGILRPAPRIPFCRPCYYLGSFFTPQQYSG